MTVSSSRWEKLALTLSGLLAAASVVVAIVMVERGRSAIAAFIFMPPAPDDITRVVVRGLYPQLTGLTIAGALAIGAILVACLGRFVLGRRVPRDGSPWAALWLALLPACLGVLLYGWAVTSGFDSAAYDDPSLKTAHLREILVNSHRWLDRARLATWLVVGAIAIATLAWTRRSGPGSTRGMLIAAGILVTGVVAFALTRKQAADQSPLPVLPSVIDDVRPFEDLPRLARCPIQDRSLPLLRFGAQTVKLDIREVDPDSFADRLTEIQINYPTLHPGEVFSGPLVVAAKGTTLARIIPYLQKRPDGLWMMASIWEEAHPTRTLGTIRRYQHCERDFKLSETAPPISRYQTWGALAAAIDRSSTTFEAAPW
jgi:hypothetical protein